ncbi:Apc13p [Ostreococcus tauri]|uniref:Apc13p n=1 Tax=Ostreococcus tauri TaxID=70448 RepID=A0A090N2X2_OSTTA|nr:Apc13p [Ostreococcus tauri]CEF97113.1 Apc13p [Ostreococcus tauri]|eukprot:XP_022838493.1 Apc13p [Ostreococcus tauri]
MDDATPLERWRASDVVDDEWANDRLPDDEVQLRAEMTPPVDDAEEANETAGMESGEDEWKDLGLQEAG